MLYIRWLFQRTKSNEDVIQYCSTELLRQVDSEHIKLKKISEFFSDDRLFFSGKNNEEVDQPIFESNQLLLIENKRVLEDECEHLNSEVKEICESSKAREVGSDNDNSLLSEENRFSPYDNEMRNETLDGGIDSTVNDDDNYLHADPMNEVFIFSYSSNIIINN